jgi:hydrogenase maturation protease
MEDSRSRNPQPATLIIGVGNPYRGDDAVGLVVARQLRMQPLPNTTVIEETADGAKIMDTWKDVDKIILIDAVHSGAKAGTVYRFDAHTQPIPRKLFHYSTHAFGLSEAIALARSLNQLPPRLIVYGIEGKTFDAAAGLSAEVEGVVSEVVDQVLREVRSVTSGDPLSEK